MEPLGVRRRVLRATIRAISAYLRRHAAERLLAAVCLALAAGGVQAQVACNV